MPSYLTSTTLVESVKRRAHIPESQSTFTSDDFLAFANEEVSMGILPAMLQYHEEYLVYTQALLLLPNTENYPVPDRAIGAKVRGVFFMDSSGNLKEMARIPPEDEPFFQKRSTINDPHVFYFQNNNIVLVPSPSTTPTGSLIVKYYQRPNQLVAESAISIIQSIDRGTGQIVVDKVPSGFSVNTPMDFIEETGAHKCLDIDVVPLSVNSSMRTLTFNVADLASDLDVGDTIALAGECFIPQIPDELHPVLAQRVACRCLEAQGDAANLQSANTKLQEMELKMGNIIDNRSDGNPQKINNIRSALRNAKIRRRRYTY